MEKIALVTGGSSGIGRAVTAALAERGDTVLFTYRVPHGAVLTTEKVRDSGWEVRPVFCELTDYAATRGLVRQIIEEFGRIDILVNNAGISNTKKLEEIDEVEWDHMMDTNLKGTFFLTQAVFQEMKRNGYGRIVSIASVAGEQGGLYSGMHYSISKGGILTMSRCFAREGAPYGITSNVVSPGVVNTPMGREEGLPIDGILLGRMAEPKEVAQAVAFLSSEGASYITGVTLDVNGGQMIR